MNLFINLWNSWSTYEIVQESFLMFSIFALCIFTIYFISRNKHIVILSALAFVIAAVLNILGIIMVGIIFDLQITEIFRLVPILTSILVVSNLGTLVGFYNEKKDSKGFKIEDIRYEYFADTTKQTIFLLLLATSMLLFVSIQTQAILVISVLSCLGGVWSLYFASKKLLK
jgi:hypothetical protein